MTLQAIPLPAFHDNYIWCLVRDGQALVVDPGDARVVEDWLAAEKLTLHTLLITHHHPDHIGGLGALKERHQPVIFGPAEDIRGLDHVLAGGETLALPPFGPVRVLATPGHTRAHLSYHLPEANLLFCGDTLFSAGCGRLFEGTAAEMHQSLQTLAALPDTTQVCCSHEYTASNLRFARTVDADNPELQKREAEVSALRAAGRPSLPVSLGREKAVNPFLRSREPALVQAVSQETGHPVAPGLETFAALRAWKDRF